MADRSHSLRRSKSPHAKGHLSGLTVTTVSRLAVASRIALFAASTDTRRCPMTDEPTVCGERPRQEKTMCEGGVRTGSPRSSTLNIQVPFRHACRYGPAPSFAQIYRLVSPLRRSSCYSTIRVKSGGRGHWCRRCLAVEGQSKSPSPQRVGSEYHQPGQSSELAR